MSTHALTPKKSKNGEAKMLQEEDVYRELLRNPETHEIVTPAEKEKFEKWLVL